MNWRHKAVCRDSDPELFFPVGDQGPAKRQIAEAKAVCGRCPVTSDCLSDAVGDDHAVRGGTTPQERRNLTRTR